jgi:hypothetical protein
MSLSQEDMQSLDWTDASADTVGQLLVVDCFMEGKLCSSSALASFQLFDHAFLIHRMPMEEIS